MKKLLYVFSFLSFSFMYSQSTMNQLNEREETKINHWKDVIDLIQESPNILAVPELKLVSYTPITNSNLTVRNYLKSPIAEDQFIISPFITIEQTKKRIRNSPPREELKRFSEFNKMERYFLVKDRNDDISPYINTNKKIKFLKIKWEYQNKPFYTICLIVNDEIVFDYLLSSIKSIVVK